MTCLRQAASLRGTLRGFRRLLRLPLTIVIPNRLQPVRNLLSHAANHPLLRVLCIRSLP